MQVACKDGVLTVSPETLACFGVFQGQLELPGDAQTLSCDDTCENMTQLFELVQANSLSVMEALEPAVFLELMALVVKYDAATSLPACMQHFAQLLETVTPAQLRDAWALPDDFTDFERRAMREQCGAVWQQINDGCLYAPSLYERLCLGAD
jgi:hypothetical protein